jgi:hypothetical protein
MIALITILPSLANKRVQCNVGEPLAVGKCNEAVTVIREVTTITDNHTEAQKMGRCVNDLAQCNITIIQTVLFEWCPKANPPHSATSHITFG